VSAVPEPKLPPPCHEFLHSELLELGDGRAVVRFRPDERMTNPFGTIQGGILAAMLDNCIGPAMVSAAPDRRGTLVQLSVNYLGAARPGEPLLGSAEVIKLGRTQIVVDAWLKRESDGELLVRGTGTNLLLEGRHAPVDIEVLKG